MSLDISNVIEKEKGIDYWIGLLKNGKQLMKFTNDELSEFRIFIRSLDNNELLDFANKYNNLRTNYVIFLVFIGALFQEEDANIIFNIKRRYDLLRKTEEGFLETADRVRDVLQKTS